MAGILAGGLLVTAALQLGSWAIPDRARYVLHIALLVLAIAMLLESLAGRQRQPPQPRRQLAPRLLTPGNEGGVVAYGALIGVAFPIRLQNYVPLLAGALVVAMSSWTVAMSVAVGWALGHSTHLLHPLVTDREVVLPDKQSVLNRSRVSFAVCVAVLVWTVAVQSYA